MVSPARWAVGEQVLVVEVRRPLHLLGRDEGVSVCGAHVTARGSRSARGLRSEGAAGKGGRYTGPPTHPPKPFRLRRNPPSLDMRGGARVTLPTIGGQNFVPADDISLR